MASCLQQQRAQGPELELELGLAWGRGSGEGGGGTEEARRGAPRGVQELGQCKEEGQTVAEEVEQAGGSLTGTQWWDSRGAVERSRLQLGAARSLQVRLKEVNGGVTETTPGQTATVPCCDGIIVFI